MQGAEPADGGGERPTPQRLSVARVLDEDLDLAEALDPAVLAEAREASRAAVLVLDRGDWRPRAWPEKVRNGYGLLFLDGLLLRRVQVFNRIGVELLAAGDVMRPWQREDAAASVRHEPGWRALEPCRLAMLDVDFITRMSPYPQVAGAISGRILRRARNLAVNLAIVQQPKVETRLHMLLWHLADRFGTVGPAGVTVQLRLAQTVFAALVAARRPTVSAALGALEREGKISRTPEGWRLHGPPPGELRP